MEFLRELEKHIFYPIKLYIANLRRGKFTVEIV
jgi:hypothetical protein